MASKEESNPHSSVLVATTIFQFFGWAFALVATPIAMFEAPRRSCYTMWGYKQDCGSASITSTGAAAFGCDARAQRMHVAAGFSVVAVIASLVALVFVGLMNTKIHPTVWWPIPFDLVAFLTSLIAVACVASVHNSSMCNATATLPARFGDAFKYTAGFALLIVSFSFNLIAVALMMLLRARGW